MISTFFPATLVKALSHLFQSYFVLFIYISGCGMDINAFSGYIQSKNYYPNSLDCQSVIRVPFGRVQFTLLDIPTESGILTVLTRLNYITHMFHTYVRTKYTYEDYRYPKDMYSRHVFLTISNMIHELN